MEKPKPDTELPPDPALLDDTKPKPRDPKPAKVTPLDESKKIEEGIEIKET